MAFRNYNKLIDKNNNSTEVSLHDKILECTKIVESLSETILGKDYMLSNIKKDKLRYRERLQMEGRKQSLNTSGTNSFRVTNFVKNFAPFIKNIEPERKLNNISFLLNTPILKIQEGDENKKSIEKFNKTLLVPRMNEGFFLTSQFTDNNSTINLIKKNNSSKSVMFDDKVIEMPYLNIITQSVDLKNLKSYSSRDVTKHKLLNKVENKNNNFVHTYSRNKKLDMKRVTFQSEEHSEYYLTNQLNTNSINKNKSILKNNTSHSERFNKQIEENLRKSSIIKHLSNTNYMSTKEEKKISFINLKQLNFKSTKVKKIINMCDNENKAGKINFSKLEKEISILNPVYSYRRKLPKEKVIEDDMFRPSNYSRKYFIYGKNQFMAEDPNSIDIIDQCNAVGRIPSQGVYKFKESFAKKFGLELNENSGNIELITSGKLKVEEDSKKTNKLLQANHKIVSLALEKNNRKRNKILISVNGFLNKSKKTN